MARFSFERQPSSIDPVEQNKVKTKFNKLLVLKVEQFSDEI